MHKRKGHPASTGYKDYQKATLIQPSLTTVFVMKQLTPYIFQEYLFPSQGLFYKIFYQKNAMGVKGMCRPHLRLTTCSQILSWRNVLIFQNSSLCSVFHLYLSQNTVSEEIKKNHLICLFKIEPLNYSRTSNLLSFDRIYSGTKLCAIFSPFAFKNCISPFFYLR